MNSNLMLMTTMMRAMMRIVMTMSLNLKPNASHVCLHEGKWKLAQKGVQQWQQRQVWSYLGVENGSKQPGNNRTMAMRGAPSGPKGLFVGLTVGVPKESTGMGFVGLTVAESDVSMRVDARRVLKAQLLIARLTAGASDASMQVGVERVP
jgi:hypothetical protein